MSFGKQIAVYVVALIMVVSLVGASTAVAVDRTVLDADHVAETLEEEGVYGDLEAEAQDEISGDITNNLENETDEIPDGISLEIDGETVASETVTETYIAGEFNENIKSLLAFLEEDTDGLELSVNLEPVQDSLAEQFDADSITVDTTELVQEIDIESEETEVDVDDEMLVRMNEDQAGYEEARFEIRSQGAEDVPIEFDEDEPGTVIVDTVEIAQDREFETEESGVEIDDEMIVRMNEDEDGYQDVRFEVRSQGVEDIPIEFDEDEPGAVVVDTVEIAQEVDFETDDDNIDVDNEMIARMNEDPVGYEEVRADIRQQVRDEAPPGTPPEQIDNALEGINDEMKENAEDQARDEYGGDISEQTLQNIIALQNTVIDGLTDPDLDDFSEYESQRDADEAALEESLGSDIDGELQEANADIKDDAAEQARDEYGDEVSEDTLQDIIALQNTVIDGLTDPELTAFSEYESQRDADEETLEDSLGDEIDEELREAAEEIRVDAAEQVQEEYGDEVSNETLADINGLQNTVIAGLTDPELTDFSEYETKRSENETALEASLAEEIRDEIDGELDDEITLSDELDEDNDGIETAQSGVGLIGSLALWLPLLFLGLVGAVYGLTRSTHRTLSATGVSLIVAGTLGAIISFVASGPVLDTIEERADFSEEETVEASFFEGLLSVIETVFSTLTTQSLALVVLGVVLVAVVYADKNGYLDSLKESVGISQGSQKE